MEPQIYGLVGQKPGGRGAPELFFLASLLEYNCFTMLC